MDGSTRSTREKILDTALALLNELGYDKLTQPQVARAAGITQGHLTYYFPTRSDLLLAVAERSLLASMTQFMERTTKVGHGEPNVNPDTIAGMVRQALLEKQRTRTILGLVVASDRDREIKKPLREMIVHGRELAATLLGALGAEPTPGRAVLMHACIVGLSVVTFALDSPKSDRELGEAAERLLRLMASDATPKRRGKSSGAGRSTKAARPGKG